jgi:hypothetical protein
MNPASATYLHVILSEAKDLMPVIPPMASGDEILRFAQDDRGDSRRHRDLDPVFAAWAPAPQKALPPTSVFYALKRRRNR